jgi:hypothetical protein
MRGEVQPDAFMVAMSTGHGRSSHGGVWRLVNPEDIPIGPEG